MNVETAPAVGSRTESIVAMMSMLQSHRERRSSPDELSVAPDIPPVDNKICEAQSDVGTLRNCTQQTLYVFP